MRQKWSEGSFGMIQKVVVVLVCRDFVLNFTKVEHTSVSCMYGKGSDESISKNNLVPFGIKNIYYV